VVDTKGAVRISSAPKGMTKPDIDQELGVTNVLPASTWQDWAGGPVPAGTLAVGRDPMAPSQDEMVYMIRRDGQARALLNLLTLPIRAAFSQGEWTSPDGGGEEEAAFANLMWKLPAIGGGMEVSSSMFLRQTLLALAHGFSAFEIIRQIPESGPLEGKITLKKMGYRDPRTVTFLSDQHGQFQGFRQITNFGMRAINVVIEEQNAWYWAANEEENPMYGVSYFEPAFQHYQMKRKLYYIGHLAAQLAAVPGRIGEIPLGASPRQIQEFKTALANFAFNTAMVAPPNFKVTPFNGNSGFNFLGIVDHHNTMMAGSVLAKFLQQEDRQVLIDNGKGDASADMFVQMLEAITTELSEAWSNKLMPQFIDYNFGSGNYPIHRFAPLTDANKQAIFDIFNTLVVATSLNCTPEFVRTTEEKLAERLGYDIDYEAIAQQEAEAAAAQQAQMEQEQALAQQQAEQPQGPNLDGTGPNDGGATGGASNAPQPPANNQAAKANAGAGQSPFHNPSSMVRASHDNQIKAMDALAVALSGLIDVEDVPENYAPEGEVKLEAGE
jgi:hypothetical protein